MIDINEIIINEFDKKITEKYQEALELKIEREVFIFITQDIDGDKTFAQFNIDTNSYIYDLNLILAQLDIEAKDHSGLATICCDKLSKNAKYHCTVDEIKNIIEIEIVQAQPIVPQITELM